MIQLFKSRLTDRFNTVVLVERENIAAGVRALHRHNNLTFGITWRGEDVCSSGWDGKVICTDSLTGKTKVIAEHPRSLRFVHSAGNVLVYTVEDGGVWVHVVGEATPRLLYSHQAEPYRVAVSDAGNVASGANDGSLMAYEQDTGTVHIANAPHTARVYQLHWRNDELQTSSYDGTTRTWSSNLVLRTVTTADQPIRDLELLSSGWIMNVGGTRLWLHSDGCDLKLETGPTISDLSVSTDSRFASAVIRRDLIVYDVRNNAIAAIRVSDASADCVHFVDATTMIVCGSSGELLSISVETLPFVKLLKERTYREKER